MPATSICWRFGFAVDAQASDVTESDSVTVKAFDEGFASVQANVGGPDSRSC